MSRTAAAKQQKRPGSAGDGIVDRVLVAGEDGEEFEDAGARKLGGDGCKT
jgi:hypothetical protein